MTLGLVEFTVEAVKSYLETNLDDWIDQVNTRHGTPDIDHVLSYHYAEKRTFPQTPSIFVAGDASYVSAEGNGGAWMNTYHDIVVVILDTDPDTDIVQLKLYRHVEAIVDCLLEGRKTTFPNMQWRSPYAVYSPIYSFNSILYKDAQVRIKIAQKDIRQMSVELTWKGEWLDEEHTMPAKNLEGVPCRSLTEDDIKDAKENFGYSREDLLSTGLWRENTSGDKSTKKSAKSKSDDNEVEEVSDEELSAPIDLPAHPSDKTGSGPDNYEEIRDGDM